MRLASVLVTSVRHGLLCASAKFAPPSRAIATATLEMTFFMTVSCCLTVGTFANSGKRNVAFSARKGKYRIGIKSIHNGYGDAISESENSDLPGGRDIPFFDARIEAGWAMLSSRTSASSIANETVLEPRGLNREHRSLVPQ